MGRGGGSGLLLHSLWAFAVIYVATLVCSSLCLLLLPFDGRGNVMNRVSRAWAVVCLWAARVKVEVEGLENVVQGRSYVLVANHQGFFDIWSLLVRLPIPIRFVAKKELMLVPIFGSALKRGGHIVIDRSDRVAAAEQIQRGRERILRIGASLLFFAEGTRSADGRIGPFKKGGFVTAIEMGLPILPMAIRGSFEILQKRSILIHPGRVRIRVLPEVAVEGYTLVRREELMERVRGDIVKAFEIL
ncbi:MAG: 1-acyl-sn-glycerol-3-phosphate acyltransferase [Nitrospirae bacterium]|nr:1-acyl-sn-glycerol-3-phosphate acyltransferase [Nitrospirota bacterium]